MHVSDHRVRVELEIDAVSKILEGLDVLVRQQRMPTAEVGNLTVRFLNVKADLHDEIHQVTKAAIARKQAAAILMNVEVWA